MKYMVKAYNNMRSLSMYKYNNFFSKGGVYAMNIFSK